MNWYKKTLIASLTVVTFGCGNDYLNISPTGSLGDDEVIETVQDLDYALNGAYTFLEYYRGSVLLEADLMADDLMCPPGKTALDYVYQHQNTKYNAPTGRWNGLYKGAYHINSVLEKAEKIKDKSSSRYKEIIAELHVIRAIMHFDVNVRYGPMPGNLGKGGINANALGAMVADQLPEDLRVSFYRNKVTEVYDFIIKDVESVINDLPKGKRPAYLNYWGAKAFMARVYLYHEDWDKALAYAEEIIKDGPYDLYPMNEYVSSWADSYGTEAIFEMPTTDADNGGWYTLGYYSNGYKHLRATLDFLALRDADPSDVRFKVLKYDTPNKQWMPSYKYPGRNGNEKVCNPKIYRLSEIYLIAAEAALKSTTKPNAALAGKYLSDLREKRTTTNPRKYETTAPTIDDILYERRVELFAEGHRAFDLWRNQRDVVRWTTIEDKDAKGHWSPQRVVEWNSHLTLWPISNTQLEFLSPADRETQQNPGF